MKLSVNPAKDINFVKKVSKFAQALPPKRLRLEVLSWLHANKGGRLPFLVSVSGGIDSLSLLYILYTHFPDIRERFHVIHFNHGVRGDAADADEEYVKQVADVLGFRFHSKKHEVGEETSLSESELRELRIVFFNDVLKQTGAKAIFFGHQQDDVAETMLMRLARGSGTSGLAAPRPVHIMNDGGVHLRPLLSIPKIELRKLFEEHQLHCQEDASNDSLQYTRNSVRHVILPEFVKLPPGEVLVNIGHSRDLLQEDEDALQAWLRSIVPQFLPNKALDRKQLVGKPRALIRRALHEWLLVNKLDAHFSQTGFSQLLDKFILGHDTAISAGSLFIRLKDNQLNLEKAVEESGQYASIVLCPGGTVIACFPDGSTLSADWVELDTTLVDSILTGKINSVNEVYLNIDEKNLPLTIRPWLAGDRYHPLGAPGSRKLQDIFTDKKISFIQRKKIPVITGASGGIVWAPGLSPADSLKISSEIKTALRLTYQAS